MRRSCARSSAELRVLHIGKFYPPHPGGIERFTADLAHAQHHSGLQPAVLAHSGGTAAGHPPPFPVRLVRSHGRLLFVPVSPDWAWRCRRLLQQFRPDLLHVHLPNPSAFWMLGLPAARALPWIVHWHADVPEDTGHRGLQLAYPLYRGFERRMLARARTIIATSARYRDASRPLQPFLDKVDVVPLGIGAAPAATAAPDWPGTGLRLLAVGRLSFYKGFDVLIDALARAPEASLLLIGDGEQASGLRQQIAALGLQERVRMLGRVDDATLEAAYRACDVLCLPSIDRSEAFGLVLVEAMRAGKPVLASAIPGSGVAEVVDDGATGRLLPLRDPAAWAAAITALAQQPALREAWGQAGFDRWRQRFRIAPVSDAITTIYRAALADRRTAG